MSGTLQDIVTLVHDAIVSPLDRWKLLITPNDGIALLVLSRTKLAHLLPARLNT
jgi:hypothetical protein